VEQRLGGDGWSSGSAAMGRVEAWPEVVVASCLAPIAAGTNCHGLMREGLGVLAARHCVLRVVPLLSPPLNRGI
jgi:hypothetical protein